MVEITLFRETRCDSRVYEIYLYAVYWKKAGFYGALLKACNSIVKSNNLRWSTHQPLPPSSPPRLSFRSCFLKIKLLLHPTPSLLSLYLFFPFDSFFLSFFFFALPLLLLFPPLEKIIIRILIMRLILAWLCT